MVRLVPFTTTARLALAAACLAGIAASDRVGSGGAAAAGEWPSRERFDPRLAQHFADWTRASMAARHRGEGYADTRVLGPLARMVGSAHLMAAVDGAVKAEAYDDKPLPLAGNLRAASTRVADLLSPEELARATLFVTLSPIPPIPPPPPGASGSSAAALTYRRHVALGLDGVMAAFGRRAVVCAPLSVLRRRLDWEGVLRDLAGALSPPTPAVAVAPEDEAERLLRAVVTRPEFVLKTVPSITVLAPGDGGAAYVYYRHGGLTRPEDITEESLDRALDGAGSWLAAWLERAPAQTAADPAAPTPTSASAGEADNGGEGDKDKDNDNDDGADGGGGDGDGVVDIATRLRAALALDSVGRIRARPQWRAKAAMALWAVLDAHYRENPLEPSLGYLVRDGRPDAEASALALLALARCDDVGRREAARSLGDRLLAHLLARRQPDPASRPDESRAARSVRAALARQEACLAWMALTRRRDGLPTLLDAVDGWMRHYARRAPPAFLLPALTKGYFRVYGVARRTDLADAAFASARRLAERQRLAPEPGRAYAADECGFFDDLTQRAGAGAGAGRSTAATAETAEAVEALTQGYYLARLLNDGAAAASVFPAVVWGTRALLQARVADADGLLFLDPEGRPGVGAFRRSAADARVTAASAAAAAMALGMVRESFTPEDYAAAGRLRFPTP